MMHREKPHGFPRHPKGTLNLIAFRGAEITRQGGGFKGATVPKSPFKVRPPRTAHR